MAAPRSGAGKTTVTVAIAAALRRRGVAVRTAKSGPDYIDPGFHAAATGAASLNLDSWAMPPALLGSLAAAAARDAEILLVESAMGLFDGVGDQPGRRGAAADLAARFGWPVLLVLDVSGPSQSAAAVARGFARHEAGVRIAGVVLNRVGSDRHRDAIVHAMAAAGIAVLGGLPRDPAIALPERHLGLVQAQEQDLRAILGRLADRAEAHLDLDGIAACAAPPPPDRADASHALPPPGQRVALAQDAAFSFVYPHLTDSWRQQGAEIVPFSPLADEPPPNACDSAWLPGGYPELHAGPLAAAAGFAQGLARFAQTRPVHGECGGYMVLGARLQDPDGAWHAMPGLLGHATSFSKRRLNLGYREATLLRDTSVGPAGGILRGHEFHYATVTDPGTDAPLATMTDAAGRALGVAGGVRGRVSGSFFHAIAATS